MLPYKDNQPSGRFPWVTLGLVLANLLIYAYQASLGDAQGSALLERFAVVPQNVRLLHASGWLPLLTAVFLHANWLHVATNVLFLWVFGNNVEAAMGRLAYLVAYLVGGVVGNLFQVAADPGSTAVILGASGAIATVFGAYWVFFPRGSIRTFVLLGSINLPARVILVFWFIVQLFSGAASLTDASRADDLAYFAHVGGFVAGLVAAWLMLSRRKTPSA